MESVTGGTGLIAKAQFDVRGSLLELLDQFVDVGQLATDLAVVADFASGHRDGNAHGIFVDVETEIVDDLFHGCLVLW